MNYVSSVAERAIVSVDYLLSQAMTYAWTSTLHRRCPGRELPSGFRLQAVEDVDGGDLCSSEAWASTQDSQPHVKQ
jgi:hypothetical protein